jgi:hypothetical protein
MFDPGYNGFSKSVTLAERWNGTKWEIQHTPNPDNQRGFTGVSCASASTCTAVGIVDANRTLAERWNGTRWTVQRVPLPATGHAVGGALNGVSCPTSNECTSVGYYLNQVHGRTSGLRTLAEHRNR